MSMERKVVNVASGTEQMVPLSAGEIAAIEAYAVSPEGIAEQVRALDLRLERLVSDTARGMGYASTERCLGYLGSSDVTWAAEARAFSDWRDSVWKAALVIMAEVQAGTRAVPTEAELIAAMPVFTRPGA